MANIGIYIFSIILRKSKALEARYCICIPNFLFNAWAYTGRLEGDNMKSCIVILPI